MSSNLVAPGATTHYDGGVTRKISISLPDDLDEAVREAATADGLTVSTWLARAARRALEDRAILLDGRAAILEEIAEHGPFTGSAEDQAWVDAVLADAGIADSPGRRAGQP
jgi:hypothetical protein